MRKSFSKYLHLPLWLPLFFMAGTLLGETPQPAPESEVSPETVPEKSESILSPSPGIEEVVHFVLKNNNQTKIQQLEIAKSDTDEKKLNSIYSPGVYFDASSYVKKDKPEYANFLMGDTTTNDTYAVGYTQLLPTGTYVSLEASDTRYDSNAGDSPAGYLFLGELALLMKQPAVHTGALTLTLSQELLKDGFGFNQRRMLDIARNGSRIQKEQMTYQLSQLVVQAMVEYWSLAVKEENLETQKLMRDSISGIRNITVRKMRYGLAEKFQMNQWNALYAQSEIKVDDAENQMMEAKRSFLKTMNLPDDFLVQSAPGLRTTIPTDINVEEDILHAQETRPDIKSINIQIENLMLSREMAENNMLPSVTLNGQLSSRDQSTSSWNAYKSVPSGKYPEASIQFRVEYPLMDEGSEVELRNANLSIRQLEIQKTEMARSVRDDILNAHDDIMTGFRSLEKAEYAVQQTDSFYRNILQGYRQGRFSAETLRDALDALFQARFGLLQAKIGFNVALVSYEMKSNRLWEKYNVNIDEYVNRAIGMNGGM